MAKREFDSGHGFNGARERSKTVTNTLFDVLLKNKRNLLESKEQVNKNTAVKSDLDSKSDKLTGSSLPVDNFISSYECGVLCEKVLNLLNTSQLLLGLALDWPSQYNASFARISSFHICYGENLCIFFKADGLKKLPLAFTLLIQHENAKLVGHNIINDLHKIRRDFNFDTRHLIDEKVLRNPLNVNLYCDNHDWSYNTEELICKELIEPTTNLNLELKFTGKIHYLTDFPEIAATCEKLLTLAESGSEELVLGFDQEWPPTSSGWGKVSLMQICPNVEECYIFQLTGIKSLPRVLLFLLRHPKVKITGLNINNDIRKLGKDFKCEVSSILSRNTIELTSLANEVLCCFERWSLAGLVLNQFGVTLSKDPKVRCSNWGITDLSESQLMYAATDAYASLLCYQQLDRIRKRESQEK